MWRAGPSFAARRCRARLASTLVRAPSALEPPLPITDAVVWALLRNLRVLEGMRAPSPPAAGADAAHAPTPAPLPPPRALVAGVGAARLAARMAALEPALRVELAATTAAAVTAAATTDEAGLLLRLPESLRGERLDCAVVSQPLLSLRSRAQLEELRDCLDPERGCVGLVWVRAAASPSGDLAWVEAFADAVRKELSGGSGGGRGSSGDDKGDLLLPPRPGQSPMEYVDTELRLESLGFRPALHRKFVERLRAPRAALLPLLGLTHDFARPGPGTLRALEAGRAAALALPGGGGNIAELTLDIHVFHALLVAPRRVAPH